MTPPRPSRKAARAERANLKQLAHEEKKARLIESPPSIRAPRVSADVSSFYKMNMTWCTTKADLVGEWSWGQPRQWSTAVFEGLITAKMNQLTSNSWNEIESMDDSNGHKLNHSQDVGSLCAEAQERWGEIGISTDIAFRFRLSGKERLWGYRSGSHFYAVWYDACHLIYPVELRNT